MTTHEFSIHDVPQYGRYSAEIEPLVTIQSGDTVVLQTIDAGWHEYDNPNGFDSGVKYQPRNRELERGHAMVGPICVKDAKAGMVIAVKFTDIVPHDWGWSGSGWRENFNERYDLDVLNDEVVWRIADDKQTAINKFNHRIKLSPFIGNIAMPPNVTGDHSTAPPRWCGGNIDCKEIIAGSTLYLPVPVDGGYLFIGDGHAVQGNGEVAGPALECAMSRVEMEITLHDDLSFEMPLADTPAGWVTFGFNEDLTKAKEDALYNMVTFIAERYNVSRTYAHGLISLVVDLNITQIVNPILGVHAILPHDAIEVLD